MNNRDLLISIIILAYNAERWIKRCIESVQGQTYQNIEIIAIDDGSGDSTAEILESYKREDSRISVTHKRNEGIGFGVRDGVKIAKGDYIVFVDSDDCIDRDLMEKVALKISDTNADLIVFGLKYYDIKDEMIRMNAIDMGIVEGRENVAGAIFNRIGTPSLCKAFQRRLLQGLQYIRQNVGIDELITAQAAGRIKRIAFVDDSFYRVSVREESVSHAAYQNKAGEYLRVYGAMLEWSKEAGESVYNHIVVKYLKMMLRIGYDACKAEGLSRARSFIYRENRYREYFRTAMKTNAYKRQTKACKAILKLAYVDLGFYVLLKRVFH